MINQMILELELKRLIARILIADDNDENGPIEYRQVRWNMVNLLESELYYVKYPR